MGRKIILGVLGIASVVMLMVFLPKLFPAPVTQVELDESEIRDRYPDIIGNVTYQSDCLVCDKSGCRQTGSPCWRFNYTRNESGGVILSDSSVDSQTGKETSVQTQCTEWWCTAGPCDYQTAIVIDDIVHDYVNYGCDNPSPTCDQGWMRCRPCEYREDCIREETFNQTYRFSIIGTTGYAEIGEDSVCRVYEGGDIVAMNNVTVAECRVAAEGFARCGTGSCSFEISFGMIPY